MVLSKSMQALLLPFPSSCTFGVNFQAMPTAELFTLANVPLTTIAQNSRVEVLSMLRNSTFIVLQP